MLQSSSASDVPVARAATMPTELLPLKPDTPCRRCGYNLRGLTPAGQCPECGSAVRLSIHTDLLQFADPRWVETLARGITLSLWGILVTVLATTAGRVAGKLAALPETVVDTGLLAASGIGLYGAYLLTAPDPGGAGDAKGRSIRRWIRALLGVGLAGSLATLLRGAVVQPSGAASELVELADALLAVGGGLAFIVGLVGEYLRYVLLGKLALRVPRPDLSRTFKIIRVGMTAVASLTVVAGLGAMLAASQATPQTAVVIGVGSTMCIGVVVQIGFMIAAIAAQMRLRKLLREQAWLGRQVWAGASASAAGQAKLTAEVLRS